jgi:hypothetical protein
MNVSRAKKSTIKGVLRGVGAIGASVGAFDVTIPAVNVDKVDVSLLGEWAGSTSFYDHSIIMSVVDQNTLRFNCYASHGAVINFAWQVVEYE